MLQRIQSIFLSILAIMMIMMFYFPIWTKIDTTEGSIYTMYITHFKQLNSEGEVMHTVFYPYVFMGVLAGISVGVALCEIFLYRYRRLQIKLGVFNSLIITALVGLVLYLATQDEQAILPNEKGAYQLGFMLPAIAIICNVIADRFIKRDENLVQSVDRIR